MRNDVKLGFAIGGVLLAVLIAYVLVVPGGGKSAPDQVSSAVNSKPAPAKAKGDPQGDAKRDASRSSSGVSLEPVTPPPPAARPVAPPSAPPATFTPPAGNDAQLVMDTLTRSASGNNAGASAAPAAPAPAPAPAPATPAPSASPAPQASASKDLDWSKLLNEPPMMQANTPVAAGNATPAEAVATATPAAPSADAASKAPAEVTVGSSAPEAVAAAPQGGASEPQPKPADPAPAAEPPAAPAPTGIASGGSPGGDGGSNPTATVGQAAAEARLSSASPTPAPARTHVVQRNETLSSISAAAYGNANHWPSIVRANPNVDPNRLKVGTTINLPALADVRPAEPESAAHRIGPTDPGAGSATTQPTRATAATATAGPVDPTKQYRVQSGDSLHKISIKLYGKSTLADRLYESNKQSIGVDPHKLKVGQVLALPEPPTIMATTR